MERKASLKTRPNSVWCLNFYFVYQRPICSIKLKNMFYKNIKEIGPVIDIRHRPRFLCMELRALADWVACGMLTKVGMQKGTVRKEEQGNISIVSRVRSVLLRFLNGVVFMRPGVTAVHVKKNQTISSHCQRTWSCFAQIPWSQGHQSHPNVWSSILIEDGEPIL